MNRLLELEREVKKQMSKSQIDRTTRLNLSYDVYSHAKDVIEDTVLKGYTDNKSNRKQTIKLLASCIKKFKKAVDDLDQNDETKKILATPGRDRRLYFLFRNTGGVAKDLKDWSSKWSISGTGGLLADLGLALKKIIKLNKKFDSIMNQYLRTGSDHVRNRKNVKKSQWSDDIKEGGFEGNAGPSSTTTQLLRVADTIGTFEDEEIEAMMVALIMFWKKTLKRTFGGGYHTAVEVWAPYNSYMYAKLAERREAKEVVLI